MWADEFEEQDLREGLCLSAVSEFVFVELVTPFLGSPSAESARKQLIESVLDSLQEMDKWEGFSEEQKKFGQFRSSLKGCLQIFGDVPLFLSFLSA